MKNILSLFIFTLIINSFLFAQDNHIFKIDSLITEGNYSEALKNAQILVTLDSINANSWIVLGKTNRLNQHYTDAVFAYEKANLLSINNKALLLILAKTYKLSANRSKAVKIYKQVLQLDSSNVAAQINLSGIYLKQGKFNKAYVFFEQLYKSDTLNSEYVRQMGYCKYRINDIVNAFELYKKSYELNNQNLNTIYWLSNIYSNSQKYDTATAIINLALIHYPYNGRLYASRGNVSFKQSHNYRSAEDYKKAIELEYVTNTLKKNLGKSLYAIKKYHEAKEVLESLIIRDTVDYQVCNYLGHIYNALRNYDKALMFYDYAIRILTPGSIIMSSIYSGMSDSYAGKGQFYKQIDYIKKRSKQQALISPDNMVYQHFLEIADIYDRNIKDKKMALKYYQKYWNIIKDWDFRPEHKEQVLAKINHLKEDLHFEN